MHSRALGIKEADICRMELAPAEETSATSPRSAEAAAGAPAPLIIAAILHNGGSSADISHRKIFSYGYFIGRNAFTFARKHGNLFQKTKLFIMLWVGVLGRIAFFTLDNTTHAILGQGAFVNGMIDGMRGRLRPELITVTIAPRTRLFRRGIRARLMSWLDV